MGEQFSFHQVVQSQVLPVTSRSKLVTVALELVETSMYGQEILQAMEWQVVMCGCMEGMVATAHTVQEELVGLSKYLEELAPLVLPQVLGAQFPSTVELGPQVLTMVE